MEQRTLYVGLDLGNEYSSISCFHPKTSDIEPICVGKEQGKHLIPTVLGVNKETKDWLFGEEAILQNKSGKAILIDNLLNKIMDNETISIYGTDFSPIALLERFLRKTLLLLKTYFPSNNIKQLVVTIKHWDNHIVEGIYQALDNLGIKKDRAMVQSYMDTFPYYVLNQETELWQNDVGLFDFDKNGLSYIQLKINRYVSPHMVMLSMKDYKEILNYNMLLDDKEERLADTFQNIAKNVLHKQVISTIYVTGCGFDGDWADRVLKELCIGRRVFKGNNLYNRGSCYAAKELVEKNMNQFVLLQDEMLMHTIIIPGYYNAGVKDIIVAKSDTIWSNLDEKIDFILDDEVMIPIIINDIWNKEVKREFLKLEGITKRPNKMTRIEVRMKCLNKNTLIVTVKDKGFGDFYPTSNRIWEKEIGLDV